MMRRASRLTAGTVNTVAVPCTVAAALVASRRLFGSRYSDDLGHYKRPIANESRSAAHRHPTRREMLREQRATAAAEAGDAESGQHADNSKAATAHDTMLGEDTAEPPVPRNSKPKYEGLFKKPEQRLSFSSNFREPDMKPILNAAEEVPPRGAARQPPSRTASAEVDDTDVTRIYSTEEVHSMEQQQQQHHHHQRAGEAASPPATAAAAQQDDDEDEFAEIRSHPFFMDMLRRVERNMIRFRKETRTAGRYSLEAVNECVRPLLQLTDYPLTARQLSHLSHSISPAVLKSSLRDRAACMRLQLYRSQDTDLLLDWSREDFLRRRYESVHLSWEPMDVICRRFGWTPEMMADRDYLLYFSAFHEFVEMAEMQTSAKGELRAVPIEDPVARAAASPIPANRLLLRRRASVEVEPSLTESIRLMGTPAVATPAKGKKVQRMRQQGGESVSDYFGAVEAAASAVDGDEATKLHHAMDTVPPLRQASHPGGRTIREFSIPKTHAAAADTARPPAEASQQAPESNVPTFDQGKFQELSSAYHNTKVENSLLRRRMLGTDSVDKAQEMEAQLASGRREQVRLEQELESMRELKRHAPPSRGGPAVTAPLGQPQYSNAPEHQAEFSKNGNAAEDIDDDEIEQALKEFKEKEALQRMERRQPVRAGTTTFTTTTTANDDDANLNDGGDDEVEGVMEVVEDTDGGQLATSGAAADEPRDAGSQPWQDELSAAVEQQEAEMEEQADDFATALDEAPATTPASRLEQLASLHDRLSSAADRARRYATTVQTRRQDVLEKLDCQLADANTKVEQLVDQLAAVEEERTALRETMAREEAERKALEMEAQLKAQRERRLAELEQQRERARVAQEEAARAVERQRAAEREALAMEEELQRKLREVQSKLRSLQDGEPAPPASVAAAPAAAGASRIASATAGAGAYEEAEEATTAVASKGETHTRSRAAAVAEEEESLEAARDDETTTSSSPSAASSSSSPASAGQFMCTPEQYDGLHLAADRLKKEIAALEAQMEEEGDEDDETLMAVLAASRADLEELEECIGSVHANAPWAATRDAKRAREHAISAKVANTDAHRLQGGIDNHRFQISLLEKRLQHATQRAVTAKLRDRIVVARRAISQLRMEQDRLRRTGRDAMGLPPSMSIAETLAHEGKEDDEAKLAEEGHEAAVGEHEDGEADAAEAGADAEAVAAERDASYSSSGGGGGASSLGTADVSAAPLSADAEKLRVRLDSMVKDIQQLQDSIEVQERTSDYDDGETEVALREMKDKLSQLLRLRDQVQRALVEESVNAPAASGGSTPVIRPVSPAAAAPPVVGRGSATVLSGPAAAKPAAPDRVPAASKKIRSSARSFSSHRRR
ncbi:hypothetical protein NESM_000393900 [Novymonas esmeraldas]|uniref:Uncharacterized protein n=1 Tax=Novymonas esmeraldas TaxID=1808958 RepID=A0AAW0EM59_9TRYP